MAIKLTSEQPVDIDKEYAIYSYPIQVDFANLLTKVKGEAVAFWQSADKKLTYLGIDPLVRLEGQNFSQVKKFQQKFADKWQNLTLQIKSQPILLGGFAFDKHGRSAKFWGALDKGYFILPQVLFTQQAGETYVTLLVSTGQGMENKLNQLADYVNSLVSDPVKQATISDVIAEELGVPEWLNLVKNSVVAINESKMKKVVLARQLHLSGEFNQALIMQRLMNQQTNTYHFLLSDGQHFFIGASPERLLRADEDNFQTASVAGSIPRGKTNEEDQILGAKLLNDPKNEYEHQVVVNRIKKIMEPYTTKLIIGQQQLLKNHDIQHIYHPFTGKRKADVCLLDVLAALHPTPALGGEPRVTALKWLAEKEPQGRGMYGGPIGWLGLGNGQGEFAVGLRSGIFNKSEGFLYAGCGIVGASDAEKERQETKLKFQPMLRGVSDQWTIKKP